MAYPIIKVYKENGSIIIDNGVKRKEYASPASVSYYVLDDSFLRSVDIVTLKAFGLPVVTDKPVDSFCYEDGVKISPNVVLAELLAYFDSLGIAQNSGGVGDLTDYYTKEQVDQLLQDIVAGEVDLSNYVTVEQLATTLQSYPTNTTLASYYTSQQTNVAIANSLVAYYTKTQADSLLTGKVDKQPNARLITDAEATKLAGLDSNHFKGEFLSLSALQTARPTAVAGDYAYVDAGVGANTLQYNWDTSDNQWVQASSTGTSETPASIKSKYESNANTNPFTDLAKTTVANTSGINSGDETAAGIRSKLGITTLSGNNTGDQDLSGLVPNTRTVNSKPLSGNIVLTQDDVGAGATNTQYSKTEQTKLSGIATGATANANTDTLTEGTTNKYFTENRVLASILSGISFVTSTAITATDSILSAFGKLQAQITAAVANLNNQITGINNKIDKNAAQLYFKQYFTQADLDNDFTQVGLTTPATVDANGHIILTRATAGNFDQYLAFNGLYSNDESLSMEVTYMLTVASDANTKGFAVGLKSTNTVTAGKFSFGAHFNNAVGTPAVSVTNLENNTVFITQAGGTGMYSVLGNILKITYSRGPSTQTGTAQNLTRGGTFAVSGSTVTGFNGNGSTTTTFPNTGQLAMFVLGTSTGSIKITSIRVTTNVPQTPFAAYFTDSKSIAFAGGNDLRHPVLFTNYFNRPVAIFAGPGDETKDLLLGLDRYLSYCKPKYGIVCIGLNDVARGNSLASTMVNYASIISKIRATGAIVVHLLPIPQTAYDQTALKAAIISAYPNDYKIDIAPGWDNTTMLSTLDGVHPNYDGHRYIAKVTYDFFIANNLS